MSVPLDLSGLAPYSARASGGGSGAGITWALGIVGTGTLLALLGLGGSAPPAPYFGTRLGMTEGALRQDFEDGRYGRWTSSEGQGLTALRWTRTADRSGLPFAVVFELNEGKLVAIRADLEPTDPLARGPTLESSFGTVASRQPDGNGRVHLTVLSRACSKHVAEAARLIASAHRGTIPTE